MKNNYVFILDENGNRITSIVDNKITNFVVLARAKESFPDAAQYIYIADGDKMLDEFINGKIYVNGEMVEAPVVEPSVAELKKTKIAEIKASYEAKYAKYEAALIRARLANNEKTIAKLQEQYKNDLLAMAAEIKELG